MGGISDEEKGFPGGGAVYFADLCGISLLRDVLWIFDEKQRLFLCLSDDDEPGHFCMEFVTVNLLLSAFHPLHAFLLTLMVNARHLFYGISMLEKYKNMGWKKPYLIYGMCDESFSVNCTADPPPDVDRGCCLSRC